LAEPISPTVRRRELRTRLRRLRIAAGKTLADAAQQLEYSQATVSRFETGQGLPKARDVRELCRLYGVTDERVVTELVAIVGEAHGTGWWESWRLDDDYLTYIGLEASATSIKIFEGLRIPALVQTLAYAEATLNSFGYTDEVKARRLDMLRRRQESLTRPASPTLVVVLDEAALHRVVGSEEVMTDQIRQLEMLSKRKKLDVRIISFSSGAHLGMHGSFTILSLPPSDLSDVVYIEGLMGQFFLDDVKDSQRYDSVFESLLVRSVSLKEILARQ
jgi:transcriptional regulator with XRE-family HTH domain